MRANSLHSSPSVSNPVPGATFAAVCCHGDVSPIAAAVSRLTHLWRSQWKETRTVNPSGHKQWIYCVTWRADLPGEMSRFFGVRLREKAWEEPKQTQSYTFLKLPEVTSSYCHLPRSHWLLRGWRGWWSASSLYLVSLLFTGDIFGLRTDWGEKKRNITFDLKLFFPYMEFIFKHMTEQIQETPASWSGFECAHLLVTQCHIPADCMYCRRNRGFNVRAADSARSHCALCTVNSVLLSLQPVQYQFGCSDYSIACTHDHIALV